MKLSIKWKIFIYMLGFTAVLLGLLWFFQTVYLDEFYKKIKTGELEDAYESVEAVIYDENAKDAIEAVIISIKYVGFKVTLSVKEAATIIPADPLTTPHTSPITSQHIDANLSEFLSNLTE